MNKETEEANELFTKALHNAIAWQNRCVELWEIIEMFCLDAEAEAEAEAEKVECAYTCVGCDYLSWANNLSCECQSPPLMKFKRVKIIR